MSVFHLKYRPTSLEELDLAEVGEKLKKILSAKEVPQSFLFAGPKGSGKTSAARIVAKLVNCEKLSEGEACGTCNSCLEIAKGGTIDILEMDAASNRGIEDVKSLKDRAYLSPARLTKKVFIIDEVHMLTREAFNALLKLIEEPPRQTIFILCTTDPQKIPETVLSRLVRVDFRKGKKEELKKSLRRIIKGEKMDVEEEVIEILVGRSDGSFRNLQKMFNELVLEVGDELRKEVVVEYLTKSGGEYSEGELEADLRGGRIVELLENLEKMANLGVDFKQYRERLLRYFQERLLGVYGVGKQDAGDWSGPELSRWMGILIAVGKYEKETAIDQLPLEMAVVEFANQIKKGGSGKTAEPVVNKETMTKKEVEIKVVDNRELREKLESEWGKVLVAVKPFNHSVEAFLRAARPKIVDGKTVVCEVFYPFHKDKLEEERNRRVVEKGLAAVLGVEVEFRCVLSSMKKQTLVIGNDTPLEAVNQELADEVTKSEDKIYEVAKEIFG